MNKSSQRIVAVALVLLGGIGIWAGLTKPWETPRRMAHRHCSPRYLNADEVDELIETIANSNLRRGELLRLYRDTFCGRGQTECVACVGALLEAAGVK